MIARIGRRKSLAAITFLLLGFTLSCSNQESELRKLTIGTGTPGGTFHPLGRQFATVLMGLSGRPFSKVTAKQTSGSQQNIDLLLSREVDIAFSMAPAVASMPIEDRSKVRVLARLYTDILHELRRQNLILQEHKHIEVSS